MQQPRTMFALILLTNGKYTICEITRIHRRKKNKNCIVSLDDQPPCRAQLLACNESREMLMEIKKLLNTGSPRVQIKTLPNDTSVTENSSILDSSVLDSSTSSELMIDKMAFNATSKLVSVSQNKISESPTTVLSDSSGKFSIDQKDDNNNCNRQQDLADAIEDGAEIHDNRYNSTPQSMEDVNNNCNPQQNLADAIQDGAEIHDNRYKSTPQIDDMMTLTVYHQTSDGNNQILSEGKVSNALVCPFGTDHEMPRTSYILPQNILSVMDEIDTTTTIGNSQPLNLDFSGIDYLPDESLNISLEYDENRQTELGWRELDRNIEMIDDLEQRIEEPRTTTNVERCKQFSKDQHTIAGIYSEEQHRSNQYQGPTKPTEDVSRDYQQPEQHHLVELIHNKNNYSTNRSISKKCLPYDINGSIDDQTDDDSDYQPSERELSTDEDDGNAINSGIKQRNSKQNRKSAQDTSTESNRLSLSFSANVPGKSTCDDTKLTVEPSRGPKGDKKYNCCLFCEKLLTKIARHLIEKHKDQPAVQKFINLPKSSAVRRHEIGILRKKGNFLFNTNPELNTGSRIVARRPHVHFPRTGADYAYCAKCKGSYSKNTLRIHFAKCTRISSKKHRLVMLSAKQVAGMVHPSASAVVRNRIIPVLRDDHIARAVRYDELLISYANKQCKKYRSEHYDKMIRQRLRMMGRFLLAVRSFNKNVVDFASIFDPEVYDDCILGVNSVAGLDEATNAYNSPSTASMIGTLVKQIGKMHISDCIKKKENVKLKNAEDFLKLLDEDYTVSVNSTVAENQAEQRLRKIIQIPSMDDIQKLHDYLSRERQTALKSLKTNFTLESWRHLAETLLTSVQLFNRRRAGEVERMKINDFERHRGIDKDVDKDLWKQLSETAKTTARKYVRFEIRGKKRRPVPVLLTSEMLECVQIILACRRKAKVLSTNPYVFGTPTNNKTIIHKHLNACLLMRKFSCACDANNPESLRGTELRKHMATKCLSLNLNEQDVGEVANFMGHSTDIHKQVYRQTIVSREIMKISKLLEKAQGDESGSDNDDTGDENDDESSGDDGETSSRIVENPNSEDLLNANGFDESGNGTKATAESNQENNITVLRKGRGRPPSNGGIKRRHNETTKGITTPPAKKRRSSSPHGFVKRVTWTQPEKDILLQQFGSCVSADSKKFPSLKSISEFISKNAILQKRAPRQVKSWLSNEKQKNRKAYE